FFQAEDGIRDFHVTGVQTCALPISEFRHANPEETISLGVLARPRFEKALQERGSLHVSHAQELRLDFARLDRMYGAGPVRRRRRSEERRVGKVWRSRGVPDRAVRMS